MSRKGQCAERRYSPGHRRQWPKQAEGMHRQINEFGLVQAGSGPGGPGPLFCGELGGINDSVVFL